MKNYILKIECKDQNGLLNKISHCISKNSMNIDKNDEFVDNSIEPARFYMRSEISGSIIKENFLEELKNDLPSDAKITLSEGEKKRIVVLGTKEHHCLGDLLIRDKFNEINAIIEAVISNYNDLKDLTDRFNIPYHFITHENKDREIHEDEVIKMIEAYNPDYIVLAKYMRILTPKFVEKFEGKIINIHHSFLPAFIGANPYKQAFERGVKIIGATSHFVNNDLDEGPIIAQEIINVDHTYDAKAMRQAGREAEKAALARALKFVFDDKVFVYKNKTIILK